MGKSMGKKNRMHVQWLGVGLQSAVWTWLKILTRHPVEMTRRQLMCQLAWLERLDHRMVLMALPVQPGDGV